MKRWREDDLPEPRPKRRTRDTPQPGQPLPVPLATLTGQAPSNFVWKRYSGSLQEHRPEDAAGRTAVVIVSARSEIQTLWNNGYFGTVVVDNSQFDGAEYSVSSWEPGQDLEQESLIKTEDWAEDPNFWKSKEDDAEKEDNKEAVQDESYFPRGHQNEVCNEDDRDIKTVIECKADNSSHDEEEEERLGKQVMEEKLVKKEEEGIEKNVDQEDVGDTSVKDEINGEEVEESNKKEEAFNDFYSGESEKLSYDDKEACKGINETEHLAGDGIEDAEGPGYGIDGPGADGPGNWAEAGNWFNNDEEKEVNLNLELCEAFFLSYALGCLVVELNGDELSLLQMWRKYSELEPDFPYRYAVYHQLRCKGWVVRSGTTMGSDWTLYRKGPPFFHSTYCVRVEVVCGQSGRTITKGNIPPLSWADLFGLNRLNEGVKKDLLVARVELQGVQDQDLQSPHVLRKLAVRIRRFKRWQPGEMRWEIKPEVPVKNNTNFKQKQKKQQRNSS